MRLVAFVLLSLLAGVALSQDPTASSAQVNQTQGQQGTTTETIAVQGPISLEGNVNATVVATTISGASECNADTDCQIPAGACGANCVNNLCQVFSCADPNAAETCGVRCENRLCVGAVNCLQLGTTCRNQSCSQCTVNADCVGSATALATCGLACQSGQCVSNNCGNPDADATCGVRCENGQCLGALDCLGMGNFRCVNRVCTIIATAPPPPVAAPVAEPHPAPVAAKKGCQSNAECFQLTNNRDVICFHHDCVQINAVATTTTTTTPVIIAAPAVGGAISSASQVVASALVILASSAIFALL